MASGSQNSRPPRGSPANIISRLLSLRGKREGVAIAFLISGLFTALMLIAAPFFILTYLLVPVIGFALPYYMGNRRIRNILLAGLVFLLVVALMTDVSYSNVIYSSHDVVPGTVPPGSNITFQGGGVTPSMGNGHTVFTFEATVLSNAGNHTLSPAHVVILKLSDLGTVVNSTMMVESTSSSSTGKTVTTFVYNTTLASGLVFVYYFALNSSGTWIKTSVSTASTATPSSTFVSLMSSGIIISDSVGTFIFVGIFYFGIVFVFLLIRQNNRRKDRLLAMRPNSMKEANDRSGKNTSPPKTQYRGMPRRQEPRTVKKEKWTCSSCGAEVSEDAEVCSSCGEKFD